MADKDLNIIIGARNMVARGFNQARAAAKSFSKQIGDMTGGAADKTLRMLGNVAKVEIGLRAVEVATHAWKGEFDKVDLALQRLPLGLGAIYQIEKSIIGEWTGWAAKIRALDDELKAVGRTLAENLKKVTAAENLKALTAEIQLRRRLANMNEQERAKELAHLAHKKERDRIRELVAAGGSPQQGTRAERASIRFYDDELGRLETKRREAESKLIEDQNESLQRLTSELIQKQSLALDMPVAAALERIREHYRQRMKDATEVERGGLGLLRDADVGAAKKRFIENQEKSLQRLESELRQKQFTALGRDLDATLERIREHYRQRIKDATAAEQEVLERMRALDLAAAGARGQGRGGPATVNATALSARFRGLASRARANKQDEMDRNLRAVAANTALTAKLLGDFRDNLYREPSRPPLILGGRN